jgi:hypothetical protein
MLDDSILCPHLTKLDTNVTHLITWQGLNQLLEYDPPHQRRFELHCPSPTDASDTFAENDIVMLILVFAVFWLIVHLKRLELEKHCCRNKSRRNG